MTGIGKSSRACDGRSAKFGLVVGSIIERLDGQGPCTSLLSGIAHHEKGNASDQGEEDDDANDGAYNDAGLGR